MIRGLTLDGLRSEVVEALGIRDAVSDETLVRAALRRAAFQLAPASRSNLVRYVAEPLAILDIDRELVEECLDEIIAYGDLFEMKKLADDPWDAPPAVLRPAPPAFVTRSDGSFAIVGVAGDSNSALTPDLDGLLDDSGPVRTLPPIEGQDLVDELKGLGFVHLTETAWLHLPPRETPRKHLEHFEQTLRKLSPTPGGVGDLEILDPAKRIRFYKGRWTKASSTTTGLRLARRPQDYGAPLWTIALYEAGIATRVHDLLEVDSFQSPRDTGWRFQAALDAELGHPQEVAIRETSSHTVLNFYSPLPAFAERRLALAGTKTSGPGRLFSFEIPSAKAGPELACLESLLWMQVVREGDGR